MKIRLFTLAALCGLLLCSCGNNRKKNVDNTVYTEKIVSTVDEAGNVHINVIDSLVRESDGGENVTEEYMGKLPAADGPGINYDLVLHHQQHRNHGVYTLKMTYIEAEDGKDMTFTDHGRYATHKLGNGEYIKLVSFTSNDEVSNFLKEANGDLTLINNDLKRIDTDLNYTIKRVIKK